MSQKQSLKMLWQKEQVDFNINFFKKINVRYTNIFVNKLVFYIVAVCLDGSPPAYHFEPGFGDGAETWLVQLSV